MPVTEVINLIEVLLESEYFAENEDTLSPIVASFKFTWIGILYRKGRR